MNSIQIFDDKDASVRLSEIDTSRYLRLKNWGAAFLIAPFFLAMGGCQTTVPLSPDQQSRVLNQFSAGALRLDCSSIGCAAEFGYNRPNFVQLHNTGRWRELVLEIARVNYEQDMSYWYLGRAAENLNFPQLAKTYYQIALNSPRCNSIVNTCDFYLTELIPQRLNVIERNERDRRLVEKQKKLEMDRRNEEIRRANELVKQRALENELREAEEKKRREFLNTPEGKRQLAEAIKENQRRAAAEERRIANLRFQIAFICTDEYGAGRDRMLATNLLQELANGRYQIYGVMLANQTYAKFCSPVTSAISNNKIVHQKGELIYQDGTAWFYLVQISPNATAGVIGR